VRFAPLCAASIAVLLAAPASAHTTVTAWGNDELDPMTLFWIGECVYGGDSFSAASPLPSGSLHGQSGLGAGSIGTLALQAYDTVFEKQAGPYVPGVGCLGSWHYTLMETGGQATLSVAPGAPRLLTVTVSFAAVFEVAQAADEYLFGECRVGNVAALANPADGTCTVTVSATGGSSHVLTFHAEVSTTETTAPAAWDDPLQTVVEVSEGTHSSVFDLAHAI
jgi:hypothetical protein